MIKYANNTDLGTLSQKLDCLFENHLKPMAGKNKAKTGEEEVSIYIIKRRVLCLTLHFKQKNFKIAQPVFDEYETNLKTVFKYFSKRGQAEYSLKEDITLEVAEAVNLFQKSKILDGTQITTEQFI